MKYNPRTDIDRVINVPGSIGSNTYDKKKIIKKKIQIQPIINTEEYIPEDKFEKLSFQSDIFITIGYICAWLFLLISWVTPEQKEWAALVFLFLSNLSTFSAFYPIFSTTYKNPEREDWLPWMIWSAAYVILAMITFLTHDKLWHSLMFYPVSNALLHALVGIIVIVRAPLEDMQTSGSKSVISPPSVVA